MERFIGTFTAEQVSLETNHELLCGCVIHCAANTERAPDPMNSCVIPITPLALIHEHCDNS